MNARTLIGDGLGAVGLVLLLPLVIVLVGLPLVLVIRLILEIVQRL